MSNTCYTLFNEVFIKNDLDAHHKLPDDFRYKTLNFDYIKANYNSFDIQELKEILTLYMIKMNFADYMSMYGRSNSSPLFLKHKENVITVLEFIDDELDNSDSDSDSDSDDNSNDGDNNRT